uniref:COX VIIa-like protein n=3 Tax=Setaria TaxID=4554 RepID=K3XQL4_SETIT
DLCFVAASLRIERSLELFSIRYTEVTISQVTTLQESRMPELEPPFRPREKLLELQRYFQNVHKHTYLKGRYDAVTSVGIPLALAASSLFLIGRGVYNMSHGIGKKD